MDLNEFDAEGRAEQMVQLVCARIDATENDIRAGRMAVVRAVAEKTGGQLSDRSLNCDADEAEALVRAAVVGRSALVGLRIVRVVQAAIYEYALPLAERDLIEVERGRQQSRDDNRIAQVALDRALH